MTVKFHADNEALITRRNDHTNCKTPFANQWPLPEADLLESICKCQQESHMTAMTLHVKGHQDETTRIEHLTIPAQMNVKADSLAEKHHEEGHPSTTHVQPNETCKAMLTIRTQTVTTNCERELMKASTQPECMAHLQNKFDWADNTIRSISWDSLKQAIRPIGRSTLTAKICNCILPTGSFLTKMQSNAATTCPLCGAEETFEHLFRCKHTTRQKWKQQTVSTIRSMMCN